MKVNVPRLEIRGGPGSDRSSSPTAAAAAGPAPPPRELVLAKAKMDELFVHWLSQRETGDLLAQLVGAAAAGLPIEAPPMPSILATALGVQRHSQHSPDSPTSPERHAQHSPGGLERRASRFPVAVASLASSHGPPRSPTGRGHHHVLTGERTSPTSPLAVSVAATHSPSRGFTSSPRARPPHSPPQSAYPPLSPPHGQQPQGYANARHAIERAALLDTADAASDNDDEAPADSRGAAAEAAAEHANDAAAEQQGLPLAAVPLPVAAVALHAVGAQLLPRFYVPGEGGRGRGRRKPADSLEAQRPLIDAAFRGSPSLGLADFRAVCRDLVGLPALLARPLLARVNALFDPLSPEPLRVRRSAFGRFWEAEVAPFDEASRFFRLLAKPGAAHAVVADLRPLVAELVATHPGLRFLESASEFHEKYALTVATRIVYEVNTSRTGLMSEREVRRADLLGAWRAVDATEDINRVERFFSYEHFYVLYCRYWELDTDHDGVISREELLRYGGHRLSRAIVDRLFAVGHRPIRSEPAAEGAPSSAAADDRSVMRYDDFIYFMLSEEDKGNAMALKYWFDCVDVDGDGVITATDMKVFYDTQGARMASLGHDVVSFRDVLCQMSDMVKPARLGHVTMKDLVKPEVIANSGVIFDALFNLDKFVSFEQRDPFAERHKRDDPFGCDWARFAFAEYNRLAAEEEAREEIDHMNDGLGEWGA